MKKKIAFKLLVLLIICFFQPNPPANSASDVIPVIELISVSSIGEKGNKHSQDWTSISGNGRVVAFSSVATNLVNDDTNIRCDVFTRDRLTRITERVSISSEGEQAIDRSDHTTISANGRYVAFHSDSNNLASGTPKGHCNIYVHDRQTGVTEPVSISENGDCGNQLSRYPSISVNGRYVVFTSMASNLINGGTNGARHVFIYDRIERVTELVSVSSSGEEGILSFNNQSAISYDGRYVTFTSLSPNLVSGDTNRENDVFVRDRQTGVTERVSVSSSGEEGNARSYSSSISGDGRFVAFESDATNLIDDDTNKKADIYVHDRQTGITERISKSNFHLEPDGHSNGPIISLDGRFVIYGSGATNLVSGDTNEKRDVFVTDRLSGITKRVSVSASGEQSNDSSFNYAITPNGRFVVFMSKASNLVSGDADGLQDVYVRDMRSMWEYEEHEIFLPFVQKIEF